MFFNVYWLDSHGERRVRKNLDISEALALTRTVLIIGGEITSIIDVRNDY